MLIQPIHDIAIALKEDDNLFCDSNLVLKAGEYTRHWKED